jgi:hypothetical protein
MLLEALVACAGVTLNAVATAIGVVIQSGVVRAEGDLDFRGTLGVAKARPEQILVSNVVAELCIGKGLTFQDLGEVSLNGFDRPIRVHAIKQPGEH